MRSLSVSGLPSILLAVALLMGVAALPSLAYAGDAAAEGESVERVADGGRVAVGSLEAGEPSGERSEDGGDDEERIDYRNVVNEQVFGDFFFVMVADTVLLTLCLGALVFLAYRPMR